MHCIACMRCLICVSLGDVWGTVLLLDTCSESKCVSEFLFTALKRSHPSQVFPASGTSRRSSLLVSYRMSPDAMRTSLLCQLRLHSCGHQDAAWHSRSKIELQCELDQPRVVAGRDDAAKITRVAGNPASVRIDGC